jgi:hypothetical protein
VSTSLIGRLLRPVTLLAAGMLLSQATLSIAAPTTTAATTLTRMTNCASYDFRPIDSQTDFIWHNRTVYRTTDEGDGYFLCDADLPNKATVTKVRFTVRDVDDRINVRYCALVRQSLMTAESANHVMAVVSETGMTATPGVVRRSDTSISRATVDLEDYAYVLQCQIQFHADLFNYLKSPPTGIIGAVVTYRISSTNG